MGGRWKVVWRDLISGIVVLPLFLPPPHLPSLVLCDPLCDSGSMALNRMNAAKGAALSLLNEAYKSRDKICLVAFQGDRAQVCIEWRHSLDSYIDRDG